MIAGAVAADQRAGAAGVREAKYDAENPSAYGEHQVVDRPVHDRSPTTGPGKDITLERNPNWDPKTDYRPAYLDKIDVQEGVGHGRRPRRRSSRQSQVNGDFTPPPAVLKEAATSRTRTSWR